MRFSKLPVPKKVLLRGNTFATYVNNTPHKRSIAAKSLKAKLLDKKLKVETAEGTIYVTVKSRNFMPTEDELSVLKSIFPDARIEIIQKP